MTSQKATLSPILAAATAVFAADTAGDTLQCINYAYNERGWLDSINDGTLAATVTPGDLFIEKLDYYQDGSFNGNVMDQYVSWCGLEWDWSYAYDDIDRLTSKNRIDGPYLFDSLTYDKNGNILTHQRDLLISFYVGYTYDSIRTNQIAYLSDSAMNKYTY